MEESLSFNHIQELLISMIIISNKPYQCRRRPIAYELNRGMNPVIIIKTQISNYTPAPPEGTVLPLSISPSIRPKIFFVAFFSATIDGRNLSILNLRNRLLFLASVKVDQGKCCVLFMLKQTSANTFDLNTSGRLCILIGDNVEILSDVLVDKTMAMI